jgi:Asp-tRNA(Asn)/Glu-tRNA(Gln) amidotransferase A subunit family amidase
MTSLYMLGVADIAARVQRREISPVEVVEACVQRIETL